MAHVDTSTGEQISIEDEKSTGPERNVVKNAGMSRARLV
jgi:hypothetical protein